MPDEENTVLRRGLERWKQKRLEGVEREIEEQNYIYGRASFGLKSAHETPGPFDHEFIESLWDELNHAAIELTRLEKEEERLRMMDLPQLIEAFNRDTAQIQPKPAPAPVPAPENPCNQVETICAAWRRILGIELDPARVEKHLKSLQTWEDGWKKRRDKEHGD